MISASQRLDLPKVEYVDETSENENWIEIGGSSVEYTETCRFSREMIDFCGDVCATGKSDVIMSGFADISTRTVTWSEKCCQFPSASGNGGTEVVTGVNVGIQTLFHADERPVLNPGDILVVPALIPNSTIRHAMYKINRIIFESSISSILSIKGIIRNFSPNSIVSSEKRNYGPEIVIKLFSSWHSDGFYMELGIIENFINYRELRLGTDGMENIAKYYGDLGMDATTVGIYGIRMKRYNMTLDMLMSGFRRSHFKYIFLAGLVGDVLRGLSWLDENLQMLHYDLKPSNIMIDVNTDYLPPGWDEISNSPVTPEQARTIDPMNFRRAFRAVLIDFGSAMLHSVEKQKRSFSRCTYKYTSPEDLYDLPVRRSQDLWSLGIIVAEIVACMPIISNVTNRRKIRSEMILLFGEFPDSLLDKIEQTSPPHRKEYEDILCELRETIRITCRSSLLEDEDGRLRFRGKGLNLPPHCPIELLDFLQFCLCYESDTTPRKLLNHSFVSQFGGILL
jgi:hypothetical protein